MTLPPFPYIIKINIYNEAGEIVKQLAVQRASDVVGDIKLISGEKEVNMITNKEYLGIYLPGVETPETINEGGSVFIWDAKSDRGQYVKTGVYYIKVEEQDGYGHTNVVIKEITVMKEEEYVEVRIFNSAGELVRVIREEKEVPEKVELGVDNVIPIEKGGAEIIIKYGDEPGDSVKWDGKNSEGIAVSSGTYEVQVITKDEKGIRVQASKTVIVLSEGKEVIGEVKVYPNPVKKGKGEKARVRWEAKGEGEVRIYIYNAAGELVRKVEGKVELGELEWDLKTGSGAMASQGNYICVIEARSKEGYSQRKIIKISIL